MLSWKRIAIASIALVGFAAAVRLADVPRVAAQVRAALVRDADEPDRNQYFQNYTGASVTCPFTNQCYVSFPAVPAGKRLHLTSARVSFFGYSLTPDAASVFLHLRKNNSSGISVAAHSFQPAAAAYYGQMLAATFPLDVYFEAGENPWMELGGPAAMASNFGNASPRSMSVTGHLVDLAP